MSLASRIATRGRVTFLTGLISTPREPLLFLYPPWLRNSSTASSTTPRDDTHSEQGAPSKSKLPIPDNPATLSDDPTVLDLRFNGPTQDASREPVPVSQLPAKEPPPDIATENGMPALQTEQSSHNSVNESEGEGRDSTVERFVNKVVALQENSESAKQHAITSRETYQSHKIETKGSWIPDWRVVLEDLVKYTPKQGRWLSKALTFEILPGAVDRILHGFDDYFQDIGDKHGCQMEIAAREKVTDKFTKFTISGPATAISNCAADILRVSPDVRISATAKTVPDVEDEPTKSDPAQGTWTVRDGGFQVRYVMAVKKQKRLQMRPQDIPRPKTWTQKSFLNYVEALAKSNMTSHFNRFGLGNSTAHHEVTSQLLRDLFEEPECQPAMTRQAFHLALQYFVSHNQIKDARMLFVRMDTMELATTPETFNIMVSGAVKFNDIHNFHYILHLMFRRGVAPNGRTWAFFLSAFEDVNIQFQILDAMQDKGLLNHPDVRKDVAQRLAGHEAEASLRRNQSLADFIAHMDSRYGGHWLTSTTGNYILRALGRHRLISRCWEFIHLMDSRFIKIDEYAINTVLNYCRQPTNLTGAVELLGSLPKNALKTPSEETYRLMFDLAWRARSYNVAKVVWRYACLSAATSFRMRNRIFESMQLSNRESHPEEIREKWLKYVGPVVIGLNDISEHPSRALDQALNSQAKGEDAILSDNEDMEMDRHPEEPSQPAEDANPGDESDEASIERDAEVPKDDDSAHVTSGSTETAPSQEDMDELIVPLPTKPHHFLPSWAEHHRNKMRPQITAPWGPSTVGKRTPLYKLAILKEYFNADLEIFKDWEPTRPFNEMLAVALEEDTRWKAATDKNWSLEEMLDGSAVKVEIRRKGVRGHKVLHEWR